MKSSREKRTVPSSADIVVIGSGGAGLGAAAAAAEAGAGYVVVLEKRGNTGGTSAMASGIFGADSPAQHREAILAPKDEMFKMYMSWAHLGTDARIIRAFVEKSGDTIRWIEDMGVFFHLKSHSPTDSPRTWHVPDGNGAEIMAAIKKKAIELGVKIVTDVNVRKLELDSEGKVTGVVIDTEGEETTVSARCVIIATGGFLGNRDMVAKYCPDYALNMGAGGALNQGEGINMAIEAGAAIDGLGMIMAAGPVAAGGKPVRLGDEPDVVPLHATFVCGEPSAVWVNKLGRRFISETVIFNYYEAVNALVRQPESICYSLFDADLVRRVTENGLTNLASGYQYGDRQRSPLPPGLDKALEDRADGKLLKIAESWEEIAKWIGTDPAVLRDSVEEYNQACDTNYDPVFNKDRTYLYPLRKPPFYAVKCIAAALNTMGGIKVNEHMEVLDKAFSPIPGLYAAGVDTGGWTSSTYCAALPGTAFGYAINSGRIAGESAAAYVRR